MSTQSPRRTKYHPKRTKVQIWSHGHCKLCEGIVDDHTEEFCSEVCRLEYEFAENKQKRKSRLMNITYVFYFAVVIIVILWTSGFF